MLRKVLISLLLISIIDTSTVEAQCSGLDQAFIGERYFLQCNVSVVADTLCEIHLHLNGTNEFITHQVEQICTAAGCFQDTKRFIVTKNADEFTGHLDLKPEYVQPYKNYIIEAVCDDGTIETQVIFVNNFRSLNFKIFNTEIIRFYPETFVNKLIAFGPERPLLIPGILTIAFIFYIITLMPKTIMQILK